MNMAEDKGQILLYKTPDGESRIEVRLQNETVWLTLIRWRNCFNVTNRPSPDTLKMCLRRESYSRRQPLHFLQQFKQKVKER